jgi:hypothetical protein
MTVDPDMFKRTTPGGDVSTDRQGDIETGRHDDMATQRQSDASPQGQGDVDQVAPVKMAFYLSPKVVDALERRYSQDRRQASKDPAIDRRKVSRSAIVEAALRAYLEGRE